MVKDKRLEKLIGKSMVVINKDHPHYHRLGIGKSFDKLAHGDFGLALEFEDGSSGYVFSAAEVKLLQEESDLLLSTEDIIEKLAGCNYGPREIAMYLDMSEKTFMKAWLDKTSAIRHHYEKGKLEADFDINQKLLDNAKTGNITAAQQYFKQVEERKVQDLKAQIYYGSET
ncbi:hypothetical protein CJ739_80 [Mariniflexile rhizosphaerae]|uniref:hypothetical protein n=1 Tax=unclassified Mariniflexile TaxID=2643887 RepID=UPI000E335AF6|nr:hypothetical protein [Mariniflexile sp. TRM1-10]AXP79180.1 hypothetical protein CJ739_80 [Mariniflexile sp. TRM1-10]